MKNKIIFTASQKPRPERILTWDELIESCNKAKNSDLFLNLENRDEEEEDAETE